MTTQATRQSDALHGASARSDILAMDRGSSRTKDEDGHLHVADTPISKAAVNPYLGREIVDWERLGLDPDRIYQLLRDPAELEKAAETFNGKPLLNQHKPQVAAAHDHNLTVGSVGGVYWDPPYLRAKDLHVWDADSIQGIENGEQKELSSGYRYDPDMTPGSWNGVRYDGRMTNIRGNHVALVPKGRAGSDVVVGDALPASLQRNQEITMAKANVSRQALLASGALNAYLRPKMAQDTKLDLTPILRSVTAKNWKDSKPKIKTALDAALAGKLAADADIDDVVEMLDKLDEVTDEGTGPQIAGPEGAEDEVDGEAVRDFLKGKISDEDHKKLCELLGLGAPIAGDEPSEAGKPATGEPPVTKQAMDAAIAEARAQASKDAEAATIARLNAVRAAEADVRSYVGQMAMAHDSAEAVYRFALDSLGVKHQGVTELAALKLILEAQPKPGARRETPRIAHDGAAADAYKTRFPDANRLSAR